MTNLPQQAIDCDDADHAAKLTQDALAARRARGAPCSTR
jgi:hypothetical protein